MAAVFSQAFDSDTATQRWAYLAGLWHDLGKYRPGFQRYLRQYGKSSRSSDAR